MISESEINKIKKEFDSKIATGADVKQLQYAPFVINQVSDKINLTKIIDDTFFPNKQNNKSNLLLINLEKDEIRYHSAVDEFSKLSLSGFVHIKGTYWKDKDKMVNDMSYVIDFLSKFNKQVPDNYKLKMNDFSEFNDKNIVIQDGPLACYCSHLRSMIYGYLNFSDYTIVVEDDVLISNTEKIEKYLKMIPDDWDVICLNACPLNIAYTDEPFYKLRNTFHSTHFYIIRNRVLELIFQNVYPIYDQIDILLANLYDRINIYNIVDTVYQKNFSTNTQNNLYVIMNSPNYKPIREYIFTAQKELEKYINIKLPENDDRYKKLASNIIYDVVYNYVIHNYIVSDYNGDTIKANIKEEIGIVDDILGLMYLNNIYDCLFIVINCCIKGINVHKICVSLLKDMKYIIDCFDLHNTIDLEYGKQLKAYNYGASANIYIIPEINVIVKIYNNKLRWTRENHNNIDDIYNREFKIMDKLKYAPSFSLLLNKNKDSSKKIIKMSYKGESLYDNFSLPNNWKLQLKILFNLLSCNLIVYPEFNLKNIVVYDRGYGKGPEISLIDYGLAEVVDIFNHDVYKNIVAKNIANCNVFIEILEKLNQKITSNEDLRTKQILYLTLMNNYRIENKYTNNVF
jgi:hypothetical protein